MSRICLLVFFLGIAVRFSDCENSGNDTDCTKSVPGSDPTHLTIFENIFKYEKRNKKNNMLSFSNFLDKVNSRINIALLFPGTYWCGNGDSAKNESDLGFFNKTDNCCRAHDNCKSDILSGQTKANLRNDGLFTRSACSCDHEFFNCLKNVSSLISRTTGDIYFNILKPQCFQCICPMDNCQINNGSDYCNNSCKKYEWRNNNKF